MTDKLAINRWAEEDRPREKMMSKGAQALSNAELLAILIGSGSGDDSAVSLMQKVLAAYGNSLDRVGRLSMEELCHFKGIGPAKAVTIQAALELGKRFMLEEKSQRHRFSGSDDVQEFFRIKMRDLCHEECHLLLLDIKNQYMGHHLLSRGGITESTVDIRLLLRHALVAGAPNVILAHNHPSGNPQPSRQDDELTKRLNQACHAVQLRLLDHIIIGDNTYYSYADEGKL